MKVVPTLVADTFNIKHAREDFLNLSGIPVVCLDRGNTCWDSCGAESGQLISQGQSHNNQCETKRARSARVFLVYIKHSRPAQALRVVADLPLGVPRPFHVFLPSSENATKSSSHFWVFVQERAPKSCRNRHKNNRGGSLLAVGVSLLGLAHRGAS